MAVVMTEIDSRDYFRKRAEEEREAADAASDERAAQPHRELAEHYKKKAENGDPVAEDEEQSANGSLADDFTIVP